MNERSFAKYAKINSREFFIEYPNAKSAKIKSREFLIKNINPRNPRKLVSAKYLKKELVIREIKVPRKLVPAKICDIKVYHLNVN